MQEVSLIWVEVIMYNKNLLKIKIQSVLLRNPQVGLVAAPF